MNTITKIRQDCERKEMKTLRKNQENIGRNSWMPTEEYVPVVAKPMRSF